MTQSTLRRIRIVAAAPAAALLAWTAIRLAGVDLVLTDSTRTVGPADVVAAALAGALAGWLVVAWLERHSPRPRRWWPFIGSTALALSMIGPSRLADGATAVALIGLHFVTAIVVIAGFARTLPCMASRLPAGGAAR